MTQTEDIMVTLINNQNYDTEIHQAHRPVLLLCMPKGPDFYDQSIVLHQLAEKHPADLKVCLLEEELINGFRQMLGIKGTPVFLLFNRGKERGRMLGMADGAKLSAFLCQHFPNPAWHTLEATSWE
jgi:hypothetical protein